MQWQYRCKRHCPMALLSWCACILLVTGIPPVTGQLTHVYGNVGLAPWAEALIKALIQLPAVCLGDAEHHHPKANGALFVVFELWMITNQQLAVVPIHKPPCTQQWVASAATSASSHCGKGDLTSAGLCVPAMCCHLVCMPLSVHVGLQSCCLITHLG